MITRQINPQTLWLTFGTPFETESLMFDREQTTLLKKTPSLPVKLSLENDRLQLTDSLSDDTRVLGLGENLRGMNKRGGIYESFCTDDPIHTPGKKSLYGAHNFLLVEGAVPYGIFIDYPGKVIYDIGYTRHDQLIITITGSDVDIYLFQEGNLKELALAFRRLMGESYIPPKWAFGFQQSRWSYRTSKEVEAVAAAFLENEIPCDAIYLDIDYMERYKDFTVDKEAFPDFPGLVASLKEKGFRLIPIIDAGVKIETDYPVYEEGKDRGYFCLNRKDEPFVAAVWPGKVHFPDFLNPEARRWFGLHYQFLTDQGIEGFWNDMNEPSIFYTEERLQQAIDLAKDSEGQNLDIDAFFHLTDTFKALFNHPDDYKQMYHQVKGEMVNHAKIHNLYGFNMTRSAAEGLAELEPNKRFLLFSRASTVGQGRYAGIWTGDNHSWWEHILLNLQMMPAVNQCGILYTGADTGGFSDNANAQLMIRWSQFSLFTPLFRNHAALHTRHQEPYAFDGASTAILRDVIRLRYALIPYLYSEYMKAAKKSGLFFMPLSFEYSEEQAALTDDQLLVGESLMATPVYRENARGRHVYLPETMLLWKATGPAGGQLEVVPQGHHYLKADLAETLIFLRKNRILVLGEPAMSVEKMDLSTMRVLAFVDDTASYVLYDDDGLTHHHREGAYTEIHLTITHKAGDFQVKVAASSHVKVKVLKLVMINAAGKQQEQVVQVVPDAAN
ncbi:TIM-barrel domain-containing protein [Anoxynatronum buryatiense]|uniref:Alpha-glucosidase n=1 Tax=Anoxynatronum buryatiense TaxID=489973 RepID=A0AA46AHY2_9CLOT|nr:TIM-barrel domain-containing protein [Anoxynatronum buryatiense]SMP44442.1 alpha-glucosidase [Anoxynatronum buryatiense]